ncbi:MAG: branched-chain amino acid ABC transporter permease [Candidimonas sp.]|nr:MAG: branched-chain amino acid ABC transporter permease [Candidimonas sp.]TAM24741.1 MAG: branched-chain amino acid ABC transporter permease [Candidimonas sp.]TAM80003.1 MAG: branched-chain amino acid ABC transporter permease [Candidimonas sp.]
MSLSAFAAGMKDSVSIAVGYIPVAISFGLAAVHVGVSPGVAVLTSMLIYAGASQFILVGLIATSGSLASIVGIILLMNLRHIFYGPAVLSKLEKTNRRFPLGMLAAGLTDEVFATAVGKLGQQAPVVREYWYVGLQLGAYSSWVLGTVAGAYFGHDWLSQSPVLSKALGFVLPALFFALLLEIRKIVPFRVLVAAGIATLLGLVLLPAYGAIIAGMVAGVLFNARKG